MIEFSRLKLKNSFWEVCRIPYLDRLRRTTKKKTILPQRMAVLAPSSNQLFPGTVYIYVLLKPAPILHYFEPECSTHTPIHEYVAYSWNMLPRYLIYCTRPAACQNPPSAQQLLYETIVH